MSIRLRLTLLYSAIVALTVFAFSSALYFTQAQATLDTVRSSLARQAELFGSGPRRPQGRPDESGTGILPGRWTQTRNLEGVITAHTADLGDSPLPLSSEGLRAVQSGQGWSETAQVENEPVLIYSHPLMSQGRTTGIVQVAAPIMQREQALANLRLLLTIGSSLASLAAFAIGWVLAGAALTPIHRITRTAQAIGTERNFGRRVQHVGPSDEVGQLAVTFNSMLSELEGAFRQLEQALESQRRFVADASHELRTPLTTVRGNIELLRRQPPLNPSEQDEVMADTREEVERLIRLVNQLLVLARADAGRTLQREPLLVRPLIEDVCRQARLLAPQRQIGCETRGDLRALGDRDALKQVLLILLDNAHAHTPPHASIRLSSEARDGYVAIAVSDTGNGIAPEILPHIFERFYRGSSARSGSGTGLGLAIAKELAEAHDGTLTVESQRGEGTVFTLRLPQAE